MAPPDRLFNRNFALLWHGQLLSQVGTHMWHIAAMLWIKSVTNNASLMGLVFVCAALPGIILTPIGGTIADRHSRKKIMVWSDFLNGLGGLSLALIYLGSVHIPGTTPLALILLFLITTASSALHSFFQPAVSASIPDLVPRAKLPAALSMHQGSFHLASVLGTALAGVLYARCGAAVLFVLQGCGYLYASLCESLIHLPRRAREQKRSKTWRHTFVSFGRELVGGFRHIASKPGMIPLWFMIMTSYAMIAPLVILLPFLVNEQLQADTTWYGFLLATLGAGVVIGFTGASLLHLNGRVRGRAILISLLLLPLVFLSVAFLQTLEMALIVFFFLGTLAGFALINVLTILQLTTPPEMRGRVFSIMLIVPGYLAPIAMGFAGVAADLTGKNIPFILLFSGLTLMLFSWVTVSDRRFRTYLAQDTNTAHTPEDTPPHLPPF